LTSACIAVADLTPDDDYRQAGFLGEVGLGNAPALLIVDPVVAYFDPTSPLYAGVEDALAGMRRLRDLARANRLPVIFTRQEFTGDGIDRGLYHRKVPALDLLRAGSPLAAIVPELAPAADEIVIVKRYPSAFFATDLAQRLREGGIDTLLIAGLTTSGCIRATAMDALLTGIAGTVVREAVGDRDPVQHEANLFDIAAKLADVRSEAEIVMWLAARGRVSPQDHILRS
jgi:maleamate amidohydrolase